MAAPVSPAGGAMPAGRGARAAEPASGTPPLLTAVIPIYNEEQVLPELRRRITAALSLLPDPYEVVLVDDGSADRSAELIEEICTADRRFRGVHFSRNFGHQAAVTAGLHYATGRCVIVLDADLQDPPELIEALLARWREGYDVVYGRRVSRGTESMAKRATAYLYYRTLQRLTDVEIPADVGDFCLMDRRVVDLLNSLPERNRYIRGLRAWVGFRQTAVDFERPPRLAGEPKYSFRKSLSLALNGVVSLSKTPLRLSAYLGFFVSAVSFLLAVGWMIVRLSGRVAFVPGWASLMTVLLFLGGVQLICLGVMGEYISRIYDEVKQRPMYVVRATSGLGRGGSDDRGPSPL